MTSFPGLFEPGLIGKVRIRNRIIAAPMEKNYATREGFVTQRYIDYVSARAKGGAGLIFTEAMQIHPFGRGRLYALGIDRDDQIPGLRKLTAAVHSFGAKVGAELNFGGRVCPSWVTSVQPVAPSSVPCPMTGNEIPRELREDEILAIVKCFGQAAARAKEAGFDVVEIHGAHGYLLAQFLSPYTNRRTDRYGGSGANRMRFPLEVVAEVRRRVGYDSVVSYRISADEMIDGGLTLNETVPFAMELERASVDLIDISAGMYETAFMIVQPMEAPLACLVPFAEAIKEKVTVPVTVAGRINDPVLAETLLAQGKTDFVSMARALHADPEWPNKAQAGMVDDICTCMACNQGCIDVLNSMVPITCVLNPSAGKEREMQFHNAGVSRRVVVVGGGPAGMTAAAVAAERGHQVVLLEREDCLGGQVNFACKAPRKGELEQIIRYLGRRLRKSGAVIRLNETAAVENVLELSPEVVVIATGAATYLPPIPGIRFSHVVTANEVLAKRVAAGNRVVIAGGDMVGCEVAEFLVDRGATVHIVEPKGDLALDAGIRAKWLLMDRLKEEPDVVIQLRSTVEEIGPNMVLISCNGSKEMIEPVDQVVVACGSVSNDCLALDLVSGGFAGELHVIGDARMPRKSTEAIAEGAQIGRYL